MGECGCGETTIKAAFKLPYHGNVLGVEEYRGCRDCGTGLAIALHVFKPADADEWIPEGMPRPPLKPDPSGQAEHFWLIGKRELVLAAKNGKGLKDIRLEDYETLADLLSDYGLELLQEALRQRKG